MLPRVRHSQVITTGVVSQRAGWAWRLATYRVPLKQTVVCLAGAGRRRPRWTLHSALLLRLTVDAIYLLTTWFPASRRASLQSLTWLVLAVGTQHQTAIPKHQGEGRQKESSINSQAGGPLAHRLSSNPCRCRKPLSSASGSACDAYLAGPLAFVSEPSSETRHQAHIKVCSTSSSRSIHNPRCPVRCRQGSLHSDPACPTDGKSKGWTVPVHTLCSSIITIRLPHAGPRLTNDHSEHIDFCSTVTLCRRLPASPSPASVVLKYPWLAPVVVVSRSGSCHTHRRTKRPPSHDLNGFAATLAHSGQDCNHPITSAHRPARHLSICCAPTPGTCS